ncbi:hypothetical protein B0A50_07426 [Salinomyces thailandicus]|uniref:C3H1-type domain-containing protein n=1 Tax=Salinomyces thailandicus TaxID=706561 RepID=A0A4U0TP89_9PEZI|nr:hypothetical protein B0A50_07426 [Salinomyces thailandica]
MNGFGQPFAHGPTKAQSQNTQQRHSVDLSSGTKMHQADRNGAMPITAPQRPYPGMPGEVGGGQGFAGPLPMPRSPPKNKSEYSNGGPDLERRRWLRFNADTQHVPCKFFLQGQCQAGRMCPFSHDPESSARPTPCKYFAKGGCKFGQKCALLHITPDGRVVNRMPPASFQAGMAYGGPPAQAQPGQYAAPPPPGLLSMQAQGLEQKPNGEGLSEFDPYQYGPRSGFDQQIDMTFTSASPKYGSPQNDRFGSSPSQRGLSVLDAPLPNSFDSNGISLAARNGPFAASVPSRFGIESPPSSLPRKSQLGNTALRDLHSSAFGDRGMDGMLAIMGSSPPSGTEEPMTFPKRPLHSDRLRASRPIISASLGTRLPAAPFEYSDEEDIDTDREEDLLPASLRDLIPEGRSRRESRSRAEADTPAGFLNAARRTLSGHGIPQDTSIKVGSLGTSPSRYNSMFAAKTAASKQDSSDSSGFGHVGSPLRNAGLSYSPAPKPSTNGDLSPPPISSPPRQASMSMLTQDLQRTKLDAARSSHVQSTTTTTNTSGAALPSPSAAAASIRSLPNGNPSSTTTTTARSSLDRGLSSTSVTKIDEEQALFDMDEVGSTPKSSLPNGDSGFGAIGGHRSSK